MSTDLTTTKGGSPSVLPPRLHDADVDRLASGLAAGLEKTGGGADSLARLPTPSERSRMESRLRDIASMLRPASMAVAELKTLGGALGLLLGGYNPKSDPDSMVQTYKALLQDLPIWAVLSACQDFRDGAVFDEVKGERKRFSPDFAPTAPRVRSVAMAKLYNLHAEQVLLRRLLAVRVTHDKHQDPEARERAGAMMRELADGMKARDLADRQAHIAETKRKADEARARVRQFAEEANERVRALYRELGLVPVEGPNGRLIDPSLLTDEQRIPVEVSDERQR